MASAIFFTALFLSGYLSKKKMESIKSVEDKISINLLSLETQFALLEETSCKDVDNSILSQEINSLASKLSYMENTRGIDDPEVEMLKKYYSLLEIKDYLLLKRVGEKCNFPPVFILYFYSNKGDCPDCGRTGYVLTKLREDYPQLRVYSFDYNIDLSAVKTLISLYGIENKLPAIVIDGKVYYGLKVKDEIEALFPDLKEQEATSTATTTEDVLE